MVVEDVMRGVLTAGNESSRELKHDVLERHLTDLQPSMHLTGPAPPVAFRQSTEASMTSAQSWGFCLLFFTAEPPEGMTAQCLYI